MSAQVQPSVLESIGSLPVNHELAKALSFGGFLTAVNSLRSHKAPGPDGIQAEILKSLDLSLLRYLYEYFCQIWNGSAPLPTEWKVSYLVPLPKRGDFSLCSKWRGVLLTSVVGKAFSKILAGRLVAYFEDIPLLPETQCGFRAGRSTMDMIFTLRMAMELARAKCVPLYILFVDLQKAV